MSTTASGIVLDGESRSLRLIIGAPGAAYVGPPVMEGLDGAWPSPDGKYAITSRKGHTELLAGAAGELTPAVEADRLLNEVSQVWWSVEGSAAVLYSRAEGRLQQVRIRSGRVNAEAALDVAYLGAAVSDAAVSARGRIAVAVEGQGIYSLTPDKGAALIPGTAGIIDLVFSADGMKLYALNAEGAISEVTGLEDQPAVRQLTGNSHSAIAMALSHDGSKLYLVTGDSIRIHDQAGTLISAIALDRSPSTLTGLRPDLYLLNGLEQKGMPMQVLDVRNEPAVYFIPAGDVSSL